MLEPKADLDAALARYCEFLGNLTPETLAQMDQYVAPQVRFRDPFHDVQGSAAMQRVFEGMFQSCVNLRFEVKETARTQQTAFLYWHFHFTPRRFKTDEPWIIPGTSHLKLDDQGRVTLHADYWDAASELYARWPVIGPVMRWLIGRVGSL